MTVTVDGVRIGECDRISLEERLTLSRRTRFGPRESDGPPVTVLTIHYKGKATTPGHHTFNVCGFCFSGQHSEQSVEDGQVRLVIHHPHLCVYELDGKLRPADRRRLLETR